MTTRPAVGGRLALRGVALVALVAAVTSGRAAPVVVRDDRGVAVELAAPARRVVSFLPSFTEGVCALGACGRLVGTDRFSNFPREVQALPKLGGLDDVQVERIVALKPDLVLASTATRATERLESLGLRVVVLETRDHGDVHRTLRSLEAALDLPGAAERVWSSIERDLAAAAARVPARLRGRRVYFELDATPYAAGPASFIGQTLARLGLANALGPELGAFARLNPERVVRLQPDIVIAAAREIEAMPRRPGWTSLRALRDGQVCALTPERYEWITRPGPRMGEAALALADCLAALPSPRPDR